MESDFNQAYEKIKANKNFEFEVKDKNNIYYDIESKLKENKLPKDQIKLIIRTADDLVTSVFSFNSSGFNLIISFAILSSEIYISCESILPKDQGHQLKVNLDQLNSHYNQDEKLKEIYKLKLKDLPLTKGGKHIEYIGTIRRTNNKILNLLENHNDKLCKFNTIARIEF